LFQNLSDAKDTDTFEESCHITKNWALMLFNSKVGGFSYISLKINEVDYKYFDCKC